MRHSGLCFSAISYFIFAFLSIPGFILGIVSLTTYFKDKKSNQGSTIGLVCGILATILGVIAFVLMIINIINNLNAIEATYNCLYL